MNDSSDRGAFGIRGVSAPEGWLIAPILSSQCPFSAEIDQDQLVTCSFNPVTTECSRVSKLDGTVATLDVREAYFCPYTLGPPRLTSDDKLQMHGTMIFVSDRPTHGSRLARDQARIMTNCSLRLQSNKLERPRALVQSRDRSGRLKGSAQAWLTQLGTSPVNVRVWR